MSARPPSPLERQLDYPFGERLPSLGEAIEIAPGLRWVRMNLPFQLDHVNVWLLRDRIDGVDGWTLVDCGAATDESRGAWERVIAGSLDGLPLLRVIATHMHPDHLGLADWLGTRFDAPLWISHGDYCTARLASQSTAGFGGTRTAAFMARHGWTDPAALQAITHRRNDYVHLVPSLPESYRRLLDGLVVEIGGDAWTCLAGHGHAPEHIALHAPARGLLISGDMVLPRISTNVSVLDVEPEGDPLRFYLESIERMRAVAAGTLVLPSHGRPFHGLHTRIDQLAAHHDERLAEVLAACGAAPQSANDLVPVLFRRDLPLHEKTFAIGEAIAHLHLLWHRGQLTRSADADGVLRFAALPSAGSP